MTTPTENPITDPAFETYRRASGYSCQFELTVRLLDEIDGHSHKDPDEKLSAIARRVAGKFRVTADIANCVRLRNKLLHCEFDKAAKHAAIAGVSLQPANVCQFELPANPTIENVIAMVQDPSKGQLVSDLKSAKSPVFGWLLQAQASELFEEAERVFKEAIEQLHQAASTQA